MKIFFLFITIRAQTYEIVQIYLKSFGLIANQFIRFYLCPSA